MNKRGTDQLITWLDDAYAMETGLVSILQSHAVHFQRLPHAAQRVRQHIDETERHAQRLESCLRHLGSSPSGVKSTLSSMMGTVEGASTALFRDELVKDALADYASEQFEVACYTALVTTAESLGYPEVAAMCRENLREDQAMADWLLQQLPLVVLHDAAATTGGSVA